MTLIIARKLGRRIVIASDTMISDYDGTRQNVIPGRLKSVVLGPTFSVAYCGLANQCIDAIRSAQIAYLSTGVEEALKVLRCATDEHQGQIEFVVAVHSPLAELRLIGNGVISEVINSAV